MLQGCFVGGINGVGSLKRAKMGGSRTFGVKISSFFVKPASAKHFSRAGVMVVGVGDE